MGFLMRGFSPSIVGLGTHAVCWIPPREDPWMQQQPSEAKHSASYMHLCRKEVIAAAVHTIHLCGGAIPAFREVQDADADSANQMFSNNELTASK